MSYLWASNTAVRQGYAGWTEVMGSTASVFPNGMAVGDRVYDPTQEFFLQIESNRACVYQISDDGQSVTALWAVYGDGVTSFQVGKDGNLYLYGPIGGKGSNILWHTGYAESDGATLQLQADGDLVMYPAGEHE